MKNQNLYKCKTGQDIKDYVENDPRAVSSYHGPAVSVKGPKPGTVTFCGEGTDPLPKSAIKTLIRMLVAIGLGIVMLTLVF